MGPGSLGAQGSFFRGGGHWQKLEEESSNFAIFRGNSKRHLLFSKISPISEGNFGQLIWTCPRMTEPNICIELRWSPKVGLDFCSKSLRASRLPLPPKESSQRVRSTPSFQHYQLEKYRQRDDSLGGRGKIEARSDLDQKSRPTLGLHLNSMQILGSVIRGQVHIKARHLDPRFFAQIRKIGFSNTVLKKSRPKYGVDVPKTMQMCPFSYGHFLSFCFLKMATATFGAPESGGRKKTPKYDKRKNGENKNKYP